MQLEDVKKEMDDGMKELEQFLSQKMNFNDIDPSKSERNLNNVLKDLANKQQKANQI